MLFLYYPKCSTCIRAKKHLDELKIKYEQRDIVLNNPTYEEIKMWHKKSNLDIKKFFNTSGLVYKELDLKNKLDSLTLEEKYKLLASNGKLVKRPIMIFKDEIIIGYNKDNMKYKQ